MKKVLTVLIVAILIGGCATYSGITPTSEVPPENGVVIFKLSSNSRAIGFFRYWHYVTVENADPQVKSKYTIPLSRKGNRRSAVYLGSLPEGKYWLSGFDSEQCGALCVSNTLSLSKRLGTFTVRTGTLTDLGHLIYEQRDQDSAEVVHGPTRRNWITPYLTEFYPNIDAGIASRPALGWEIDESLGMDAAYKNIKRRSKGLIRPNETSDGVVLFGSYLGNVRVWTPGKGFRSYETGIQAAIESVAELAPGVWVAGTEEGQILISENWGRDWREYGAPIANASVIGLNTYKGRLFATIHLEGNVSVYYTSLDDQEWHLVSSHELKPSFWTNAPHFPESIAFNDKLMTSLPTKHLIVLDMDTLDFEVRNFPGGVSAFSVSNDGVIRCNAVKTIVANPFESRDWGKTWSRSKHSRFMLTPYFVDESKGYGYQTSIGGRPSLATTDDGGATWVNRGEFPYRTPQFSHVEATGTVYATDGHNSVVLTNNDGETWERP